MSDLNEQDTTKSKSYNRNKIMTLIGSLLIQFSAGIIPVWGNANLYFLSYLKNHNQHVDKDTNSYILIAVVVPMAILVVFSTKISNKFGYTNTIKACALIFCISQFVVYFSFTIVTTTIFLLTIPITVITIAFIPMFNCLWSYYLKVKNTVTGYAIVSYGLGGILFNIMFLHMANPDNLPATKNDIGFLYFDQEVSNRLPFTAKIFYIVVSLIFLIGSYLIHKQDQHQQSNQSNNQNKDQHYQLKEQVQFNTQEVKQQQKLQNNEQQMIDQKNASPSQILSSQKINQNKQSNQVKLRDYIFDWKFIIIFCNVLFIDFYATFLINNFKLIYIQRINDDHFLGYCLVINTVTALIGTFIWGYLGDKLKFGKTMLIIISVDLIVKLFGIFSEAKVPLFILMFFLGFTSRGLSTISGPGLIQVFGLKVATQLLPIKALGVIGSTVLVPILQLIFLSFLGSFQFMNILIVINFFLLASTIYFLKHYKHSQISEKTPNSQILSENK